MIKMVFSIFFGILFIFAAQSAQIVNIDYIHTAIADKWDVVIPYNREITNVGVAANMKYLLTAIDVANEILNGEKTTDYGNGEFATTLAADTIATDTAVETLVKKEEKYKFIMTVTLNSDQHSDRTFYMYICAAGEFYVDWGDGTTETITKADTTQTTYSHQYANIGTYAIKLNGLATKYDTINDISTISFYTGTVPDFNAYAIKEIYGNLSAIFPTMSDGAQPNFYFCFYGANIQSIPENLFANITGTPRVNMFRYMFAHTQIESIPENLFSGLDTSSALPEGVFRNTFGFCSHLTGPSARINGRFLYEIWPNATYSQVGEMYVFSTGLSDFNNIPDAWCAD